MLTHTYTRTFNVVAFADPYKKCLQCGAWIDGFLEVPEGPYPHVPCGHAGDYRDLCPSWSPVDGCWCAEYNISHPDAPITHEARIPESGDDRVYGGPVPA